MIRRVIFAAFLLFLSGCGLNVGERSETNVNEEATETREVSFGFPSEELSVGWERKLLDSEPLLRAVDEGVEVTSKRFSPRLSLKKKFKVDLDTRFKVQVGYNVLSNVENLTPEITAWCMDEKGALLGKYFNTKLFSGVPPEGTLEVDFVPSGYQGEEGSIGAIVLNPGTKYVVFSTNPARGVDGAKVMVTGFKVTITK